MFLDKIVATKQEEVQQLKTQKPRFADWERTIQNLPACKPFIRTLSDQRQRQMGLIAEVKKASPSKGLIRTDFDPVQLAIAYEQAGADCISILTDREYFQGANEYLTSIRDVVQVPLLRKDFTIDPIQIYEARAIGADAVLLIVAILTDQQLSAYIAEARELGLDVLVEVHDREELKRAMQQDIELLGINNRDLRSFHTDIQTTADLIGELDRPITIVSESGLSSAEQIDFVYEAGARAVLIGEHFMRQPDVEVAINDLLGQTR